jgi:succinylarginine dihydrolase
MDDGNASPWCEINVDGLIGPTHHFGGLGVGNIASQSHRHQPSNPKAAALEGLGKMRLIASLGVPQYFLPPLDRPNWSWLESMGFSGDRKAILQRCYEQTPQILSAAYSSAFMWTANAATIAPATDTIDKTLHILPANLTSNLHRGQETMGRRQQLVSLFRNVPRACVDLPLPSVTPLRDEGAANHIRLCDPSGTRGIHLFVHGPQGSNDAIRFLSRQSELASRQAAHVLRLPHEKCLFAAQSQEAIDAGVFHNDVIAMSHENWLIYHELAFDDCGSVIEQLSERFHQFVEGELQLICVRQEELSLDEAVRTYLFNSQLVRSSSGEMHLLCPSQCQSSPQASRLIGAWLSDPSNPITQVHYLRLDESMANGGGPACLRLRIGVDGKQLAALNESYRIDEERCRQLERLIEQRYLGEVTLADLARIEFAEDAMETVKLLASV